MNKINVTIGGFKTHYYEDEAEYIDILYGDSKVEDDSLVNITAFMIASNCALTTTQYIGSSDKEGTVKLLESSRVVLKEFVNLDNNGAKRVDRFIDAMLDYINEWD